MLWCQKAASGLATILRTSPDPSFLMLQLHVVVQDHGQVFLHPDYGPDLLFLSIVPHILLDQKGVA